MNVEPFKKNFNPNLADVQYSAKFETVPFFDGLNLSTSKMYLILEIVVISLVFQIEIINTRFSRPS